MTSALSMVIRFSPLRGSGRSGVGSGLASDEPTPELTQGERGGLRPALAGEDPLAVASDAVQTVRGREVREVPDLLPHELGEADEGTEVHRDEVGLVILGSHM